MRRTHGVRRPISLKPKVCPERGGVDATGISVKAGAHYPGRSAELLERANGVERRRDDLAEVSRGHSSRDPHGKGPNQMETTETVFTKSDGAPERIAMSGSLTRKSPTSSRRGLREWSKSDVESKSLSRSRFGAKLPPNGTAGYVNRMSGGVGAGEGNLPGYPIGKKIVTVWLHDLRFSRSRRVSGFPRRREGGGLMSNAGDRCYVGES